MKYFVLLFLFVFLSLEASAQSWTKDFLYNTNPNFYSLQKKFNDYWASKPDSLKSKNGWKQFKRWEWFWERRINEDGSFPISHLLNCFQPFLLFRLSGLDAQ